MTLGSDASGTKAWSERRIVVTGAGGYLGSWLSRALAALRPARLTLLCRGDASRIAGVAGAEIVPLDLLDRQAVGEYFRLSPADFVFHLAGKVDQSIRPGVYAEQFRANVEPTINLTDALVESGLERLIHIGSNAEYGVAECPHPAAVRENPSTAYAVSKLAATRIVLARAASEGLPAVVGRPFLVYGDGQPAQSFLASALAAAQSGQPFRVTGGDQTRDFTSVAKFCDDVISLAALPAEETVGKIYNLCTGVETPLRQVLSMIQEMYPKFEVSYGALPYRKTEVMHSAGVPYRGLTAEAARAELRQFLAPGGAVLSVPTLSIGVPAYNQGAFLRETLESILNQDIPFDEIVVSNNHSTDSTAQVIAEIQAEYPGRVLAVTPATHLRMGANWNFTISHMRSQWISLLSSDDLVLPHFVSNIRAALSLSDNAALVHGAWRDIAQDGTPLGDHHLLSMPPVLRPPDTLYRQRFGPKGSFAAFALRRDIWQRVGGFPEEELILGGDWAMWLLAGALGDIVYTDKVISAYRTGHQPDIHRARHHIHMRELFTAYKTMLPRATQLGGFGIPDWIAKASRQRFRQALIQTSREYTPEERPKLIESFRPWSEAVGEQELFQQFERGEVLRRDPMDILRPIVRQWFAKVRRERS